VDQPVPPFVVLFHEVTNDPRHAPDADAPTRRAQVRVVLRHDGKASRVLVEVEDGEDAVGATAWYRLDFGRSEDPAKNLADARAAYAVLQDVVDTLYRRSRALEQERADATAKVKQLEARLQGVRLQPMRQAAKQVDPQQKEKERVLHLLRIAADHGIGPEERHAAAKAANEIMARYNLLKI
jgi:hypothetical protein